MNIVLLEGLAVSDAKVAELAAPLIAAEHSFTAYTDGNYDPAVLIERAKEADILMVASTPLPAGVVAACPRLKLISVAFTGVDHLPMDLCRERGILVSNCAGYSNESVAELVFGLVISLLRRIPACNDACRSGGTKAGLVGFELAGKTFGIVGTGAIGLRTAQLAKAFGCNLIAYSRSRRPEAEALGIRYLPLEQLMAEADVVSLHVPVTAETRQLINAEMIARMKPTALLINTARGPVVDNAALADALKEGRIAGAGIDVFEMEPPIPEDHPLCSAPGAILTPHVAFATAESMEVRAGMVFENVSLYLEGNPRNLIR
ncbi:hydroxyacid dehydrogenase [Anaerofilum sp. BX8]|uniref:Hydroxyacid dehydrogenase n=1 Tax=Anaerofilum hominis TaxID=2763016 RepID=A0A923IAL1_9FIRM|nr:2-hydroxyacid dehydrogenase [Anaerofilum hominis]MBC5581906.1 hydroxyacid dehydrogenase [Anaerofilum hominis]